MENNSVSREEYNELKNRLEKLEKNFLNYISFDIKFARDREAKIRGDFTDEEIVKDCNTKGCSHEACRRHKQKTKYVFDGIFENL